MIEFIFNISELKCSVYNFCEVDSNVFINAHLLRIESYSLSSIGELLLKLVTDDKQKNYL
jgi:hypothetical protein